MAELAAVCREDGALCVRRNTCCLAFRVPGLGHRTCADCCVNRPAD
jgi:ferric iron reductase protein FhuF